MWVIISSTDDGDYIAEQKITKSTDTLTTTSKLSEAKQFKTKTLAQNWVKPVLRCWGVGEEPQIIKVSTKKKKLNRSVVSIDQNRCYIFQNVDKINYKVLETIKACGLKAESGWLHLNKLNQPVYNTNSVGYGEEINFEANTISHIGGGMRSFKMDTPEGMKLFAEVLRDLLGEGDMGGAEVGPTILLEPGSKNEGYVCFLAFNFRKATESKIEGEIWIESNEHRFKGISQLEKVLKKLKKAGQLS